MFVQFSYRKRCLYASCHQKRALVLADHLAHGICQPVPQRQFVWTIPKRLRVLLRQDQELLGQLTPLAWETIREGFRGVPAVRGDREDSAALRPVGGPLRTLPIPRGQPAKHVDKQTAAPRERQLIFDPEFL